MSWAVISCGVMQEVNTDERRRIARSLGVRIRDRREECDLSQMEVSHRTGIQQTSISAIENGRRLPTLVDLYRIATALDTEVRALLPLTEESRT